jgi:putative addiction module component (TIGR02574 family)
MVADPARLRDEVLSLPTEARARLVAELLRSLEHEEEPEAADYEAAWGAEIAERLRSVDSGEVSPVPWGEARERIARED